MQTHRIVVDDEDAGHGGTPGQHAQHLSRRTRGQSSAGMIEGLAPSGAVPSTSDSALRVDRHPRMSTLETDITDLSHDGRGVAHVNGKTVFVSGALAGERVRL